MSVQILFLLQLTEIGRFQSLYQVITEPNLLKKTVNELNKLLELKSLELHVKEVKKRGDQIKKEDNDYKLSDFDTQKNEILEEIKNVKNNNIEVMVYRFQLTYVEITDILDLKYISTKKTGYSLNPGIYEVVDLNNTSKFLLAINVKVSVTKDDVRLKSNSKINQTLNFTENSFFNTLLGFTRSHSYPLVDIEGFDKLIAGL